MRRLALTVLFAVAVAAAAEPPAYKVIVHPDNPSVVLDKKLVADAFLKKVTRWPHGELIRPVDLGSESPVRQKFSVDVVGRSVAAVKSYWHQLIFSGRDVPPPELENDEAVVRFVLKRPGAIGYVSSEADVSKAKVLPVR